MVLREGVDIELPEDMTFHRKDGSRMRIRGSLRPIKDEKGCIEGVVATFQRPESDGRSKCLPPELLQNAYLRLTLEAAGANTTSLLKAVCFIEENLGEDVTLDGIAGAANMSKYHFTRVFKRQIGMSPMSFVSHLRIERAKQMLTT